LLIGNPFLLNLDNNLIKMKILLILAFLLIIPFCLKAQDETLGKSRAEIRALIGPNSPIKLSKGDICDTLTLQAGMQLFMYYKNDTCFKSVSIMPLKYESYVTDKMTKDSFKKISDNVWINASGKVRLEITVDKEKDEFYVETSEVN